MKQNIELYSVLGQQPDQQWYTSANDFQLQYQGSIDSTHSALINSAPYAINFAEQCVVNLSYKDKQALLDATFLYQHQKATARQLISIPFERLPELARTLWQGEINQAKPTLVFSTGRAGSTLLSKMLATLQLPSLSEPDVYTHYSLIAAQSCGSQLPGMNRIPQVIAHTMMNLLYCSGSSQTAIKFRGQVNSIAHTVMKVLPEANGFMVLREPVACATSMHRAFGWSATKIADKLVEAHRAVDACKKAGRPLTVLYYEDICQHPLKVVQTIASQLGIEQSRNYQAALQKVMNTDSQGDTDLARNKLSDNTVDPHFADDYQRQWRQRKQQLKAEGIALLL
jgi:hypothetical protein